ncbi:MAG: hypothetical protein FJX77_07745 [Armatimonadetes bacterium]|nr:hypothetical protein [Armatimonadota bacterium]
MTTTEAMRESTPMPLKTLPQADACGTPREGPATAAGGLSVCHHRGLRGAPLEAVRGRNLRAERGEVVWFLRDSPRAERALLEAIRFSGGRRPETGEDTAVLGEASRLALVYRPLNRPDRELETARVGLQILGHDVLLDRVVQRLDRGGR